MLNAYLGLDICMELDSYKQKLDSLKKQYNLYYSAAHLDEVLNTDYPSTKSKISALEKCIRAITALTDNKVILSDSNFREFSSISPIAMLNKRVGRDSGTLSLPEIVKISDENLKKKHDNLKEDIRKTDRPTNALEPEAIIKNEHFREFIKTTLPYDLFFMIETHPKQYTQQLISENKNLRDVLFEIVFKALDASNYYYTPSRPYEASHAMYAACEDIFITNDKRFIKRCFIVYKYLGIQTKLTYFS